jgi:hypothetical protein
MFDSEKMSICADLSKPSSMMAGLGVICDLTSYFFFASSVFSNGTVRVVPTVPIESLSVVGNTDNNHVEAQRKSLECE